MCWAACLNPTADSLAAPELGVEEQETWSAWYLPGFALRGSQKVQGQEQVQGQELIPQIPANATPLQG